MSKKKIYLFGAILMSAILAFQVYSLMKYDHFKAEGGLKVEFSVDPSDVVKRYARGSRDFDSVMEAAVLSHKKNKKDFLGEFAKANKDQLQRPLIRLINYKEIKELSASSKDDEVLEFLRTKLERKLEETASFLENRLTTVLKNPVDVQFDSKESSLTAAISAYNRKMNPKLLQLPEIKIGFYEVVDFSEFASQWNTLCERKELDALPEINNTIASLTVIDQPEYPSQGSGEFVEWQHGGRGVVLAKDKDDVDKLLSSEDFDAVFPKEFEVRWSHKNQDRSLGDFWGVYIVRVPKNGIARITENDIQSAEVAEDEYGKHVNLNMNQEGAEKWRDMTEENVGRCIAMCVNDVVLSAPNVISPISGGQTQISAGPDMIDVDNIASTLNTKSPDLQPFVKSQSIVKADPPVFSAFVQQLLIAASIILLLFFSILFVRNLRSNEIQN